MKIEKSKLIELKKLSAKSTSQSGPFWQVWLGFFAGRSQTIRKY